MDERRKPLYIIFAVVIVAVAGLFFFLPSHKEAKPQYNRESSRATVDITQTDLYQELKRGEPSVNKIMGGTWLPFPMPIPDRYKDNMIEKIVFLQATESMTNFKQALIMDTYSKDTFSTVSSYMKVHAKELHDKMPKGKIKILHDGSKGIIYQWRIPGENDETTYMELGKVSMTDEGIFSVKYINKGTPDLEKQRQRAFRLFGKL